MGYKVAVVGATGAVGREMLQTLAERNFPADKVYALASSKSIGQEVSYGDDEILTVEALDKFDFAAASKLGVIISRTKFTDMVWEPC